MNLPLPIENSSETDTVKLARLQLQSIALKQEILTNQKLLFNILEQLGYLKKHPPKNANNSIFTNWKASLWDIKVYLLFPIIVLIIGGIFLKMLTG